VFSLEIKTSALHHSCFDPSRAGMNELEAAASDRRAPDGCSEEYESYPSKRSRHHETAGLPERDEQPMPVEPGKKRNSIAPAANQAGILKAGSLK
jgi:hypothetical protein